MTSGHDYYANYGGLDVAEYVERHIRGSASEMARLRDMVSLVPSDVHTVLDIGAGHGVFLEELRATRGVQGVGVEITQAKVDYARSRGIDLRLGDASRLEFGDRAFDAVVALEVLEHLPWGTYETALGEVSRVAREWILVSVPYDERRRFVTCPYCRARVNPDYHFRSFAPGSLRHLLPGFSLVRSLALGERRRSALLDLGRRLLDRWPRFLVCPCCGYREHPGAIASGAADEPGGPPPWWRRAAAAWPGRRRPVWLVGLYRRDAYGG